MAGAEPIRPGRVMALVVVGLVVVAVALALVSGTVAAAGRLGADPAGLVGTGGDGSDLDWVRPLEPGERLALVAMATEMSGRVVVRGCGTVMEGTAFLADDTIFTNQHVVVGADQAKLELAGQVVMSEVERSWPGPDVAHLARPEAVASTATISERALIPGEPVVALGFQGWGRPVVVEGLVQGVVGGEPYGVTGPIVLIRATTVPGFSGGPVLDRTGAVVAMLEAHDATTGLTIAVAAETLRQTITNSDLHQETSLNRSTASTC